MYMKDYLGDSISDDAEFDDLDDFDYVEEFGANEYDIEPEDNYIDEDYDDLEDLYVDDDEDDDDEDLIDDDEDEDIDEELDLDEYEDEEDSYIQSSDMDEDQEEVEMHLICEDCGHKWIEFVSETEEENDMLEVNCPICGSPNISIER